MLNEITFIFFPIQLNLSAVKRQGIVPDVIKPIWIFHSQKVGIFKKWLECHYEWWHKQHDFHRKI
ncbi:hypothetical protein A3K86_13030 [Photobacterium jeanii]|uniref:Uncharacterized protein n=1 Tax=Photobacterium jeanii TaxID=858640 RepID=A0A178KAF6_9GAMM|nr:hypothetical protein A3K86_13030 [Photobacterium jeanii]PST89931.1 hypothetical protein C9I91_13235 [Photobacterium jeanii]